MDILPDELIIIILSNCDSREILYLSNTNKYNYNLCHDVSLWKNFIHKYTKYDGAHFKQLWTDIQEYNISNIPGDKILYSIIYEKCDNDNQTSYKLFLKNIGRLIFNNRNRKVKETLKIANILNVAVSSIIQFSLFVKQISDWNFKCEYTTRRTGKPVTCGDIAPFRSKYCSHHRVAFL